MRLYLLLFSAILAVSCAKVTKEQQVISDYIQNYQGTHVDLSLKFHEFERVSDVTVSDSIEIIKDQIGIDIDTAEKYARATIESYHELIKLGGNHSEYRQDYEESRDILDAITKIKKYESSDPDSVLLVRFDATYTIKNPVLGTDQKIGKSFYLTPDGSAVVKDGKISL